MSRFRFEPESPVTTLDFIHLLPPPRIDFGSPAITFVIVINFYCKRCLIVQQYCTENDVMNQSGHGVVKQKACVSRVRDLHVPGLA
jgi:hypothetical protein